jgi:16S rRNA (uracil1498-N3)-methyltransferase
MLCLFCHPGGKPLHEFSNRNYSTVYLAIGAEGGFTDAEVAAATAAGWGAVDLGPRILRVETAAVALAAALTLR